MASRMVPTSKCWPRVVLDADFDVVEVDEDGDVQTVLMRQNVLLSCELTSQTSIRSWLSLEPQLAHQVGRPMLRSGSDERLF